MILVKKKENQSYYRGNGSSPPFPQIYSLEVIVIIDYISIFDFFF